MALLIKLDIGWCEPVGGLSVFASPSLNIQADDGKPVVVLAAAMDSRSMFHDLTIGTNTDVSGVVALLAVAEALSRVSKSFDSADSKSTETTFCYRCQQPIFQNTFYIRFLQQSLGDLQAPSDLYKISAIHFHAPMHLVQSNVHFQTRHAPTLVYALLNLQRSTWIISTPLSSSIRLPTPMAQGIGAMSMIPQWVVPWLTAWFSQETLLSNQPIRMARNESFHLAVLWASSQRNVIHVLLLLPIIRSNWEGKGQRHVCAYTPLLTTIRLAFTIAMWMMQQLLTRQYNPYANSQPLQPRPYMQMHKGTIPMLLLPIAH